MSRYNTTLDGGHVTGLSTSTKVYLPSCIPSEHDPDEVESAVMLKCRMSTLSLVMFVAFVSIPAWGENRLTGVPAIITGDTLEVAGRLVRLVGVDAPETGQSCLLADGRAYDCGLVAKTALMDLTAGVSVSCKLIQTKATIPTVALCKAGGYDLSKGMAHTGWALAWPREGMVYAGIERYARQKKHGLWKGRFVAPWDWRRGQREHNLGAGKPE